MGTNSIFLAEKNTDRTLIESILASHYILDYGFIKKVNDDKTIDVTHAKQLKTMDGTTLPATVTTGVEVLTLAGGGFSISFDYKKGDKVLLLGLKNYIEKVEDVNRLLKQFDQTKKMMKQMTNGNSPFGKMGGKMVSKALKKKNKKKKKH